MPYHQLQSWPTPGMFVRGASGGSPTNPLFNKIGFFTNGNLGVTTLVFDVNFPGALYFKIGQFTNGNLGQTTLVISAMTTNLAGFSIIGASALTLLSWPQLLTIDPTDGQNGYITVASCSGLVTVSAPLLTYVSGNLTISGNANLTTLTLTSFLLRNGNDYDLHANKLNVASVNAFLRRAVLTADYAEGTILLNGGTNAAPIGQGLVDKATLILRGVTVTTN